MLFAVTILQPIGGHAQDRTAPNDNADARPGAAVSSPVQSDQQSAARLWQAGDPGQRLHLRGRVLSTSGQPISGATIMLWQADGAGQYHQDRYRARLLSEANGEFKLTTAVPGQYYDVKHIHVTISHPQHRTLNTQILFKGDPNLSDSQAGAAILLEEVRTADEVVMVGSVELVLQAQ